MKIEKKIFTKRDKIIESFYKEFFTYSAGNIGMWIAAGIMEFLGAIVLVVSYDKVQAGELWGFAVMGATAGAACYISPYQNVQEFGKSTSVYPILQYLPISRKELQNYWLKKLAIFCTRIFVVFLVLQVFISLIATHGIALWSIGYVALCSWILPFVFVAFVIKSLVQK